MTNKELETRIKEAEKDISDLEDTVEMLKDKLRVVGIQTKDFFAERNKKPQHEFKVGDRVQFKSWEEMEKEYGVYKDGDLCVGFSRHMKHLCNTYATIKNITCGCVIELCDFTANGDLIWSYNLDMLKPATDEPKCKFKVGDKVKFKNNERYNLVYEIVDIKGNNAKISKQHIEDGVIAIIENVNINDLEPYTEPRWTFTDDEKVILRQLKKEYKWIARDPDGDLFVYTDKPKKLEIMWSGGEGTAALLDMFDCSFQTVKDEDDEPCEFRKYI